MTKAHQALAPAVREANETLLGGQRSDNPPPPGPRGPRDLVGVTLDLQPLQLRLDKDCQSSLQHHLQGLADDGTAPEVLPLGHPTVAAIAGSFRGWVHQEAGEHAPIRTLARTVASAHEGLLVYRTSLLRSRNPHSGVAIVDPKTGEALWLVAEVASVNY